MSNCRSKKSCCKRNMHHYGYTCPSSNYGSCQIFGDEWNNNATFNSFNPALRFDDNIDFVKFEKALTSPKENSLTEYFLENVSTKSELHREISNAFNTQTTYLQSPIKINQVQNQSAGRISYEKSCFTHHNYIQNRNCTKSENALPNLSKDLKAMEYLANISISTDRQKNEADFIYSDILDAEMLSSQFDASLNGARNYLFDETNYLDSNEKAYNVNGITTKEKYLHKNSNDGSVLKNLEVAETIHKVKNGNISLEDNFIKREAVEPFKNTEKIVRNSTSIETVITNKYTKHYASVQTQTENRRDNCDAQVQCNIYDRSLINCAESFMQVINNISKCDLLHKTLQTVINLYSADEKSEYKSNRETFCPKCQTKKTTNQKSESTNVVTNSRQCNAVSNRKDFNPQNAVSLNCLVTEHVKETYEISERNETFSNDERNMLKKKFTLSDEENTETSSKNIDKECTCKHLKRRNVSKDDEQGIKNNYTQHKTNSTHNALNTFKRKINPKDIECDVPNSKKICTHNEEKTSKQNDKNVGIFNLSSSSNFAEKTVFCEKSFSKQTSVKTSKNYGKTVEIVKHTSLLDDVKGSQEEAQEISKTIDRIHKIKKFKSSTAECQEISSNKKSCTHHTIKTSCENIQKIQKSTCDSIFNTSGTSLEIPLPETREKAKNIPKMSKTVSHGKTCKILLDNLEERHIKNTHTLRLIQDKLRETSTKVDAKGTSEKEYIQAINTTKAPDKDIKESENFEMGVENSQLENKAFGDILFCEQTEKTLNTDVKVLLNTRHRISMDNKKPSKEKVINTRRISSNERTLKQEIMSKNLKKLNDNRHDISGKKKSCTRYRAPNKSIVLGGESMDGNILRRSPRIKKKNSF